MPRKRLPLNEPMVVVSPIGVQFLFPRSISLVSTTVLPSNVDVPSFTSFANPASWAGVEMKYAVSAVLYQSVTALVPSHTFSASAYAENDSIEMTTASAKNSENILFFIVFFSSNSVDYFGRTMRPISLDLIVALPILIYKNIILLFEQIPVI